MSSIKFTREYYKFFNAFTDDQESAAHLFYRKFKYVFIDFEFNKTKEHVINLVCCHILAITFSSSNEGEEFFEKSFWLHNDKQEQLKLKKIIQGYRDLGFLFVSYNVIAEARSMMALGLDPVKFKWVDLYLEYKMITNQCNKYAYGEQLIKGRIVTTKPYDKYVSKLEEDRNTKPEHNMYACIFKLFGENKNTEHKEAMRNLIISNTTEFTEEHKKQILEYCESDVELLGEILLRIDLILISFSIDNKLIDPKTKKYLYEDERLTRGKYSALSALMESAGYPIDVVAAHNLYLNSQTILNNTIREIRKEHPNIDAFEWSKKTKKFIIKEKPMRDWVATFLAEDEHRKWKKTKLGQVSLSIESFEEYFNYEGECPNDFGSMYLKYLKTKRSLNGFIPTGKKAGKKILSDYIGSDGRVRPYMNIYGTQTSRSAPSAISFIPAKSKWMRALIMPNPGYAIAAIDYSSQEFLINALLSEDDAMLKAYEGGDPYLYFAKKAGAVPPDGKKEDYKRQRNLFKATTLAVGYGMKGKSLTYKLNKDVGLREDGRPHTIADAEKLINYFKQVYPDYDKYKYKLTKEYHRNGYMKLPCGWTMFGDNTSETSFQNFPTQGFGASIMRKAVELADNKRLKVIFTLHDAIYIEYKSYDFEAIDNLLFCMDEAFKFYFNKENKKKIRMDIDTWSRDYKWGETAETPRYRRKLILKDKYVTENSITEYNKNKKYLEGIISDDTPEDKN